MRCMHKIDRMGGGSTNFKIGNYQDLYLIFIILNVLQTLCTAYYSYLKLTFLSLTYFVSPASQGCKILVTLIFLTPPSCTSSESYFSKIHNLKTGIFYKVLRPLETLKKRKFLDFSSIMERLGVPKCQFQGIP